MNANVVLLDILMHNGRKVGDGMIGVWMTPCKNGQCELSVRRDGINKIVIATQTPLTDAQAEELFWCIGAMRRSGKTLKDLLKEQEAVKPKSKVRYGVNSQIQHFCGNCMTMLHGKPKYCSECGRSVKWE